MNIVEMQNIVKRFGPVTASDGVDFELRAGEIHALLGENGAGKTTLMRILYGLYHQDSGDIIIGEQPAEIH
ncbi:MAG TPA: ATP-binding cassette domain-containing protein, partial [Thermoflexia bacterium]|nr:ATP-binding cassette domain-containing protein [Thermoflexia bacterium]